MFTKKELNQILEEFVEQVFVEHSEKEIEKTSKKTILENSDVKTAIFELIPDEIIVHILEYIPVKSIIRFSETSKRFHNISFDEHLWKNLFKRYFNTAESGDIETASPHSSPQSGDIETASPHSSPQSGDSYINYYKKYREYLEFTSKDIIGISDYYNCFIDLDRNVTLHHDSNGTKFKVFRFRNTIQISTGESHIAVIRKEKGKCNLYTWGFGRFGVLGHGNENDSLDVPIKVTFGNEQPNIKQVICISNTTVALTKSGNIYTWGYNGYQKIGTRSLYITKPRLIKHEKKFVQISFADGPLAAISTEGKLYLWGKSSYRLTGLKQKDYKPSTFLEIKIKDKGIEEKVKQVKCGEHHILVLTHSNKLFSLGRNGHGQLGLDCDYALTPKKVDIPTNDEIKQIGCGTYNSSILTWTGKLFFWGSNHIMSKKMALPKTLFSKKAIYMFCRNNRTGVVFNDFTLIIFGDGLDDFTIQL